MTQKEARDFAAGLKIARKFRERGEEAHLDQIADALAKVSRLAYHYSSQGGNGTKYLLQSLDINPWSSARKGS